MTSEDGVAHNFKRKKQKIIPKSTDATEDNCKIAVESRTEIGI
jgi:hypothetical protein